MSVTLRLQRIRAEIDPWTSLLLAHALAVHLNTEALAEPAHKESGTLAVNLLWSVLPNQSRLTLLISDARW